MQEDVELTMRRIEILLSGILKSQECKCIHPTVSQASRNRTISGSLLECYRCQALRQAQEICRGPRTL